jgi:PAS domain S-box-containing protein
MTDVSSSRADLLIQSLTDYAIYMLDPTGVVSSWNAGAERLKGYRFEEIVGEHFSRFYTPEDVAEGLPQHVLETALSEGRFEAEGWRVRKDGTRFWANVIVVPVRDAASRHVGFAKITRDLTERREAQQALEEAREQIFQAQKLESIGKLTGGVAHDFNNILAAVIGSLNLAKRRMGEGEDITRFLDNAIQAAQRGATLTQRMLAFARKQELKLEPVDVLGAVGDMTELLGRTIGPGIHIRTSFPLLLPPVLADRSQLELALMNLVVNARDAMPDGGDIALSASECDYPGEEGSFVCLSVSDEGEGMDPETLARAVEPFFTTKGVGKGTGLGLSMVQGMVEQCGGHFQLTSEPGKGTTATIWLRTTEARSQERIAEPASAHSLGRSLRILAVDDDPIVLLNTATTLSDMGHQVLQADSGAAALDVLSREPVDLLLTDYTMPKMNGAELIDRARESRPDLKAIIASGFASVPEGKAIDVPRLSKPFTDMDLAGAIAAAAD